MTGKCWCDCEQKMMDPTMCGGCEAEDLRLIKRARAEKGEVSWDDLKAELAAPDKEG